MCIRDRASGENVGLPDGQMGNSEVGHLNIGAGRIVYQDLVKINRACACLLYTSLILADECIDFLQMKNQCLLVHLISLLYHFSDFL